MTNADEVVPGRWGWRLVEEPPVVGVVSLTGFLVKVAAVCKGGGGGREGVRSGGRAMRRGVNKICWLWERERC